MTVSPMVKSTVWSIVERNLIKYGVLEKTIVIYLAFYLIYFYRTMPVKMKDERPRIAKRIL